jgi:hypothetical protein
MVEIIFFVASLDFGSPPLPILGWGRHYLDGTLSGPIEWR